MTGIDSIPTEADADAVAQVLLRYADIISAYFGRDMRPSLENFLREQPISNEVLHGDNYITIQFSREYVEAHRTDKGDVINPREVIKIWKKCWDILQKGWGRDPGAVMQWQKALKLAGVSHFTLDWDGRWKLHPAFRFQEGVDNITRDDVKIIVEAIQRGRASWLSFP